ncbi:hypothetical protein [Pandoraea sp. NPDC087047]|uniref:hypothetical protein n=1 Tax=Pandoraea sp. NPDC087047 TaxID=3364390 RepID=UPI00382F1291
MIGSIKPRASLIFAVLSLTGCDASEHSPLVASAHAPVITEPGSNRSPNATETAHLDALVTKRRARWKELNDAEAAYLALRHKKPPVDPVTLGKAAARWQNANALLMADQREVVMERHRISR